MKESDLSDQTLLLSCEKTPVINVLSLNIGIKKRF